ncbi:DgyrCDS1607 [Dimorphilus gyrociliatus]|uniref:type II protein arginine methyltransferase n=1 Tax=Dimorphilus gyrociliatus TaxID=2664684 RepID=A0A7I8V9P7_9ANNE|nr:DgyrCDS1607 [Dimorphilus gyrociliatus]
MSALQTISNHSLRNCIRLFGVSSSNLYKSLGQRSFSQKQEGIPAASDNLGWFKKLLPIRSIDPGKESHSVLLAEKEIVYELQFHQVKPEFMVEYLKEFENFVSITTEKKTGAELVGSWTVEIGDQDEAVHLWKYPGGYEVLNEATEVYRTDPQLEKFRLNRNKMLRSRKNQILLAFSFWGEPKQRPAEKNIYELRSYVLKPGTMIEWGNNWARGLRARKMYNEAVAGLFTHIGDLYTIHHMWAYDNLHERKRVREAAWRRPGWDDCVAYTGPITVADYMKEVLTNPNYGYYMHRDVFGKGGDFITSPEISQMFGELIAVWCVHEWMNAGKPKKLQVVELGPGRATLADDMLRTFRKFSELNDIVSLNLIEVSPKMKQLQHAKLCQTGILDDKIPNLNTSMTRYNIPVTWHNDIQLLPEEFTFFIAHEFFDALPIHVFLKNEELWREVLVDVDESGENLRFVQSRQSTISSKLYKLNEYSNGRNIFEFSPETGLNVEAISKRLKRYGGFGMIIDYGHFGTKEDTFRAFKKHKLHHPLKDPGEVDLTADVDFHYMKKVAEKDVKVFGPVNQGDFLHQMGISIRLQMLLENANEKDKENLMSGYKMLTEKDQMGERFQFLSLLSPKHCNENYEPAGFSTKKS